MLTLQCCAYDYELQTVTGMISIWKSKLTLQWCVCVCVIVSNHPVMRTISMRNILLTFQWCVYDYELLDSDGVN